MRQDWRSLYGAYCCTRSEIGAHIGDGCNQYGAHWTPPSHVLFNTVPPIQTYCTPLSAKDAYMRCGFANNLTQNNILPPSSHKRLPRDPYQVPLAYFPPFCYLAGVQKRAGAAADNETGGTNGCKSAPIINPHSFHRVSLILNESSLAHILPTFTKNVAQILCHFYPLLTLHLNHIREDIR